MNARLDQLLKLHTADPADPFLTYGIALEHAKAEDFGAALAWLDRTLKLDPDYCYAYFQKAKMLGEQGEDEAAIPVLQTGIAVAQRVGDQKALSELRELLASME